MLRLPGPNPHAPPATELQNHLPHTLGNEFLSRLASTVKVRKLFAGELFKLRLVGGNNIRQGENLYGTGARRTGVQYGELTRLPRDA